MSICQLTATSTIAREQERYPTAGGELKTRFHLMRKIKPLVYGTPHCCVNCCSHYAFPPTAVPIPTSIEVDSGPPPLTADRIACPPAPLARPVGVCATAPAPTGGGSTATDNRDEARAPLMAERVTRDPAGLPPPFGVAGTIRGGLRPLTAVLYVGRLR